jgi:hypothetical protein
VLKSTSFSRVAGPAVVLFVCVVALFAPVRAQTPPAQRREAAPTFTPTPSPSPATAAAATTATDKHDLSITANVTARELHFEVVPNPTVEFPGQPRRDTVWEAERTNLPAQIQPGVTYRDIGIRLRITSVFADIERIVAEALGEIPASDDGTPNAPQTPEPEASARRPQIDNATPAPIDATQTNAAPQVAASTQTSSTQTSRAPTALRGSSAKTTPARKNQHHASPRRGRH